MTCFAVPSCSILPVFQPNGTLAEIDHAARVRNDDKRRALFFFLHQPRITFFLERRVAHAEDLVDEQNVGIHINGDGKPNLDSIPEE